MKTITLELNNEQMNIVLDFYEDFLIDNNNPYAIARAKIDDCVITFFKSGKVVFQGENASYEASIWSEIKDDDKKIESPSPINSNYILIIC